MPQTVIQPSFAAGELAPSLFGRTDLAKYHSGLALARNVFIDYRGGVTSRPGLELVAFAQFSDDSPVLLPFIAATGDAFAILAGNNYFWFAQNGFLVQASGAGGGSGPPSGQPGGTVIGVNINTPGANYTNPSVSFSGGGGAGATAVAQLGGAAGGVISATVINGGVNYTTASVSFSGGGGTGATGTVQLGGGANAGQVRSATITAPGSGYIAGQVVCAFISSNGVGGGAQGSVVVVSGAVTAITITNPGAGYTQAPDIVIAPTPGNPGSGATATAVIGGGTGSVSGITITNPGSGYTSPPAVTINGDGTGAAAVSAISGHGGITAIIVTAPGSGYTTLPAVNISDPTGSGATATAIISGAGTGTGGGTSSGTGPGGQVQITTPYLTAELQNLRWSQEADVLNLFHPNHPPMQLTQTGPAAFTLAPLIVGPSQPPPTGLVGSVTDLVFSDGIQSYVVTAVSSGLNPEESVACFPADVVVDFPGHSASGGPVLTPRVQLKWTPPAGSNIAYYNVYKAAGPTGGRGTNNASAVNTVFGFIGQTTSPNYYDFADTPDFSRTPPQFQDPTDPGQIANVSFADTGSGVYSAQYRVPLSFTGGGGVGAAGYAVVDPTTSLVCGVVITNFGIGYATAPAITDGVAGGATYSATLGPLSGTYPICGAFYQERNILGGSPNFPSSFVASRPGLFNNFNTSIISQADDALTVNIVGRENNFIQSMTPLPTGLMVFTSGGAFLVSGGNGQAAITPTDVVAYPQASSSGANFLPPLSINQDLVYCQSIGAVVRSMTFNFYYQSYTGTDRSFLASHLFLGHLLVSWCYSAEPYRLVYAVREDGTLLVMTYVPEQEVIAWTHYDTPGFFMSVCSIPEGEENAVYAVVQRQLGAGYQICLERFTSKVFQRIEDAFCLDCATHTPEQFFDTNLFISSNVVGSTATISCASPGVFTSGVVGNTIWGALVGKATIIQYNSPTSIQAYINEAFFDVTANAQGGLQSIILDGNSWGMCTPTGTVQGLQYLAGMEVGAFADGVPQPLVVMGADGVYTLPGVEPGLPDPVVEILAGTTYTLPVDWTDTNTVICIAAGGLGGNGSGGGACAVGVNLPGLAGGQVIPITIGTPSATLAVSSTVFNAVPLPFNNPARVIAAGANASVGGLVSKSQGTSVFPGGNAGHNNGGGAAGPNGPGQAGSAFGGGQGDGLLGGIGGTLLSPNGHAGQELTLTDGTLLGSGGGGYNGGNGGAYGGGAGKGGTSSGGVIIVAYVSANAPPPPPPPPTPSTVTAGSASKILVGLPFQAQVQTLPLDVGEPTIQGKRKTIPAVTTRLANYSTGLKAGRTFNPADLLSLRLPDADMAAGFTIPPALYDGDIYTKLPGVYDVWGQLCYQMDDPLPFDILALMMEIVVGDTGR